MNSFSALASSNRKGHKAAFCELPLIPYPILIYNCKFRNLFFKGIKNLNDIGLEKLFIAGFYLEFLCKYRGFLIPYIFKCKLNNKTLPGKNEFTTYNFRSRNPAYKAMAGSRFFFRACFADLY